MFVFEKATLERTGLKGTFQGIDFLMYAPAPCIARLFFSAFQDLSKQKINGTKEANVPCIMSHQCRYCVWLAMSLLYGG